jgi:hypothetical protein
MGGRVAEEVGRLDPTGSDLVDLVSYALCTTSKRLIIV